MDGTKNELTLTKKIIIGVCVPIAVIFAIIIILMILNSLKSVAATGTSGAAKATDYAIKIGAAYGAHWLFGGQYIQKMLNWFSGAGKIADGGKVATLVEDIIQIGTLL